MTNASHFPCIRCGRRSVSCVCRSKDTTNDRAKTSITVRVSLESKGRGSKKVSVIRGLQLAAPELEILGSQLKKIIGAGGTVKDGCIEIQGDKRNEIVAALASKGIRAKRSG